MDKKKSAQKETLLKVLKYVRHYWPFLILSVAAAAVTVALTLYVPILTGEAIDYIIDKGKVDFAHVLLTLEKIGIVILFTALAQWIMNVSNNKMAYHTVQEWSSMYFSGRICIF